MRLPACIVTAIAATVLLGGCGNSSISRSEFVARLVERDGLRPEEARCVAKATFAEYNDEAIRELYDHGIRALPMQLWNGYGHTMVSCAFTDDLDVPSA